MKKERKAESSSFTHQHCLHMSTLPNSHGCQQHTRLGRQKLKGGCKGNGRRMVKTVSYFQHRYTQQADTLSKLRAPSIFNNRRHVPISLQVVPSPSNPSLQAQWNPPGMLIHLSVQNNRINVSITVQNLKMSLVHAELTSASAWQLFKLLSAHSSIFTVGDV